MIVERGTVHGDEIVLEKPLDLPDGTEVLVHVQPAPAAVGEQSPLSAAEITALPFFGMWANRDDMGDSADWVREERKQWQQRAARRD
jgi:hypothetical protein